ncbi:MAG: TonB-dependent receptor plug domain-containing protein [Deltaproteobacteria bacterium]|nr:TonB-dependent receptor plug domain-containing protein [Deltaproteobacteria bacterium]
MVGVVLCLLAARAVHAQKATPPEKEMAAAPDAELGVPAIDAAEVVMTATKSATTIQESPQIITVITDEEIRARGYRSIGDVLHALPGFEGQSVEWWYSDVFTRGQPRTLLVLWNGVPVGSPSWAGYELTRALPIEFVKRLEIVTGPGGVLWGANAFLGIVNVITYDGDSFHGFELRGGGGTGPGLLNAGRATASFGESFLKGRVKLWVGVNFSTDDGTTTYPNYLAYLSGFPPPDADGPTEASSFDAGFPKGATRAKRNWFANVAGNVRVGPVTADIYYPIVNRLYHAVAWEGGRGDWGIKPDGTPALGDFSSWSADFFTTSLTFRKRFGEKVGVVARGYYLGSEDMTRHKIIAPPGFVEYPLGADQKFWTCPSPCTQTAVNHAFKNDPTGPRWGVYRSGGSADVDLALPFRNKLIAGVEAFYEHVDARVTKLPDVLGGRVSLGYLAKGRAVAGGFVADEWRAHPRLTLHAGARVQGSDAYDAIALFSASAVYNPMRRLFLKLNYAEGFRPPPLSMIAVNDNRDPTGDRPLNLNPHAANAPDLVPERSRAAETALIATLLEHHQAIDKVTLRANYAFSLLQDLITERTLQPTNSGTRYLHSADLSLRLDLRGGHQVTLGYYFNWGFDREYGPLRESANQKLTLAGRFSLIKDRLEVDTLMVYLGPREDLNRWFNVGTPFVGIPNTYLVRSSDTVIDRLPAQVAWRAGLRVKNLWSKRLELNGFVYNVLSEAPYSADIYYSKRIRAFPVPGPGWNVLFTAILTI